MLTQPVSMALEDVTAPAEKKQPVNVNGNFERLMNKKIGEELPAAGSPFRSLPRPKFTVTLKDYLSNTVPARAASRPENVRAMARLSSRVSEGEIHLSSKEKARMTPEMKQAIHEAEKKYGVPRKVIESVIRQESGFNPKAVSHCGAQGLMQLMPQTARSLGVKDSFDVSENIDGGVRYLRQMLDEFNGDLSKALAAYNAGPGAVKRYGGIPPYSETKNYVARIMHHVSKG